MIYLAIAKLIFCLVQIVDAIQQRAFRERFPPISDAEFLARCRTGTDPAIALKVRRILSDSLGVDYDRIYPSSRIVEDLGAD